MQKTLLVILALMLLTALSGCEGSLPEIVLPDSELSDIPQPDTQTDNDHAPTENPSELLETQPSNEPAPDDSASSEIFRDFLSKNYEKLIKASFNNIAGLGFIDLDLDGSREMLVFDAGASASMGVNIFDIVDGTVECVSASMIPIGEDFGGHRLSAVSISANFLEDFRLMEDANGELFFTVKSFNGNDEFFFDEQIRFANRDGVLELVSLMYKYEEFNSETGEILKQAFRLGAEDATADDYNSFYFRFTSENIDTNLECQGFFVWEISNYSGDFAGFMTVVDKALELSMENSPSANN